MLEADLIPDVILPLVSLGGLLGGIFLHHIAPEEVSAGKKYLILLYRSLFVLLSGFILYFLYSTSLLLTAIYLVFSVVLLTIDLKMHRAWFFAVHYLFFLTGYFFSSQQLVITVMIFLYGLPVGTLLQIKMHKQEDA